MKETNNDNIDMNDNLIDEVKSFVQKYRSFFMDVEISVCLINIKMKYVHTLCKIELRPLNYSSRGDEDLDYEDVRLVRFHFPTDMFNTFLESICRQRNRGFLITFHKTP